MTERGLESCMSPAVGRGKQNKALSQGHLLRGCHSRPFPWATEGWDLLLRCFRVEEFPCKPVFRCEAGGIRMGGGWRFSLEMPFWESEILILAFVERGLPTVILFRNRWCEIKLPSFTLMFLFIFTRTYPFSLHCPDEKYFFNYSFRETTNRN